MKSYFKEIFELFANSLMVLTLILGSHLLLSNVYHYLEVNRQYTYNINDSKEYTSFKTSVDTIENNISKINVDEIRDQKRRLVALTYNARIKQCVEKIKQTDFYNINKTSFTAADVYNYNRELNRNIQPYCILIIQTDVEEAINKYEVNINSYNDVNKNLIRERKELSVDVSRLENRLLFNSSYYWTTDTVRNTIYNYTADTFFTNLSNYSRLINAVEESSNWYVNEFGGNR